MLLSAALLEDCIAFLLGERISDKNDDLRFELGGLVHSILDIDSFSLLVRHLDHLGIVKGYSYGLSSVVEGSFHFFSELGVFFIDNNPI